MKTKTKTAFVFSNAIIAIALPGCQPEPESPPEDSPERAIPAIIEAVLTEQQRQLRNTDWSAGPIYFDPDAFRTAMNAAGLPDVPSRAAIASHLPKGVMAIRTDSAVIRTERPERTTFEIKDDGLLMRTKAIEATPSGYQVSVEALTTDRRDPEGATLDGRVLQLSLQRNGDTWNVVNTKVFIRIT